MPRKHGCVHIIFLPYGKLSDYHKSPDLSRFPHRFFFLAVYIVGVCFPPARQGASDGYVDSGSWDEGSAVDACASWDGWYDECPGTGHDATYDDLDGYGDDDAWAAEKDEDLDGQPCPSNASLSTSGSNDFAAKDFQNKSFFKSVMPLESWGEIPT